MSSSQRMTRFSDSLNSRIPNQLILIANSSETLIKNMIAEGVEPAKECSYDVASLRFKFNEVCARVQKFMIDHPNCQLEEVKKYLLMLHQVTNDFRTMLRLERSIGNQPTTPLRKSTPNKVSNQPSGGSQYFSAQQQNTRNLNATFNVTRNKTPAKSSGGSKFLSAQHNVGPAKTTFNVSCKFNCFLSLLKM